MLSSKTSTINSLRDVKQEITLSALFSLGLVDAVWCTGLVDWYRDSTSVTYGHLKIDLLPERDGRLITERTLYPFLQIINPSTPYTIKVFGR